MTPIRPLASIVALTLSCLNVDASQPIHLVLKVPADTPANARLFIAGSAESVGSWKSDGLKLDRQPDGTYAADLALEPRQTLEFKFDLGSWDAVEKNADGSERANRSITVDANTKTIYATVERWASTVKPTAAAAIASTVVGTLELKTIDSKDVGKPRTIRVWLPPGYGDDTTARYDVLYMHDGQNCFDRATSAFGNEWQIDETLTKLIAGKKIRPIIVVGIDNGGADRINELTYAPDPQQNGGHGGGHAAAYAKFLIDEVMPFVAKNYRVETGQAHTFIGGSSLGGLFTLDMVRRTPGVFGGAIAMSPSLWWRGEPITPAVEADASGLKGTRVWLDIGTAEEPDEEGARDVDNTKAMDAALTKQGVTHRLMVDEGAAHNEAAWARRFPEAIQYLLGP